MTVEQIQIFAIFGLVLGNLLWGRVRYDLVAVAGLLLAVVLGLVDESRAFSGFSHPAVLIVALVLVASRAFENSGALSLATRQLMKSKRPVGLHIALFGSIAAGLSAVINNVAALALLMPVDIQAARKSGRSPRLTLMPLAFATILGGMVTLIGTPPNIIASALREEHLGAPYQMFDFSFVGVFVALAGLAFTALIGWRLIGKEGGVAAPPIEQAEFMAELLVPEGSPAVDKIVAELDGVAEHSDVRLLGLLRPEGSRVLRLGRFGRIQAGDLLNIEGATDGVASFIKELDLQPAKVEPEEEDETAAAVAPAAKFAQASAAQDSEGGGNGADAPEANGEEDEKDADTGLTLAEAVVRADARIAGRSADSLHLRPRFGITLLGVAHRGRIYRERVASMRIEPGDVLLLTGPKGRIDHAIGWLGGLALDQVSVAPVRFWRIGVALGLFVGAIAVAGLGLLSFATALAIAVAGYAATGLIPAREFYDEIEWPVIVMLACLLPLGEAFGQVGGTALLAEGILSLTQGQPAVVSLIALMVVTMTLSDILNNVATMVIAGPLAISMAQKLGVNPDTFLMGTAIAASCAFLTPIGHKNNTLIMGPGGYAFGDYWRMGLPLEILVLLVGVPALLIAWPL